MLHLALSVMVAFSNPFAEEKAVSYEEAYAQADKESRPLVVLVGADWCAACKKMKANTILPMKKDGLLKEVIFTTLDVDAKPELAEQLMTDKSLPQVIVFAKSKSGWKRFSATGMQSEKRVQELIRRAEAVMPNIHRG